MAEIFAIDSSLKSPENEENYKLLNEDSKVYYY